MALVVLVGGALTDEVDVDDRPCGSLPDVLADPPFKGCAGEARYQLVFGVACLAGGTYLLWRGHQRYVRRRRASPVVTTRDSGD